jgi:hypothetical protein
MTFILSKEVIRLSTPEANKMAEGGDAYADVKSNQTNLDIFRKGGSHNEKV